jgi:AraC family transcriptional regulator
VSGGLCVTAHLLARAPKRPPPTDTLRAEISIECDGHETLADLLTRAALALETDLHAAKTSIKRLAALLGIELNPEWPASAKHPCPRGGLAPWQAKRIRSYIEDNLGSNMRATNLAAIVQLSRRQFFRTFRKTFGEAPHAYIRRRRILRAQERMSSSQAPMVQIALECGMCDQAHFTRVFRRIVGVNPTAWRRQFFRDPPSDSAVSP